MREISPTLSKKQIFFSRIIMGGFLLITGLILMVIGMVLPKQFGDLILPVIISAFGVMFFVLGYVQQNTVLIWLSMLFVCAAAASFLVIVPDLTYAGLYPLYVASPALGSFVAAFYSGIWRDHIKVIAMFFPAAIILSLNSFFGISWIIVLPTFIIFIGIIILLYAVTKEKRS